MNWKNLQIDPDRQIFFTNIHNRYGKSRSGKILTLKRCIRFLVASRTPEQLEIPEKNHQDKNHHSFRQGNQK